MDVSITLTFSTSFIGLNAPCFMHTLRCSTCIIPLAVYISFVSAEHKVEEGGTVGVLLKCEPTDFDFQFNVTLMFVDQEAMEGSDYIAAPEVVTIQSNTANHMFAVETVGDNVAELLEMFLIKLTSMSVQDCVGGLVEISNDLNTTFITIEDDDGRYEDKAIDMIVHH